MRFFLMMVLMVGLAFGEVPKERMEAREEFQDDKFGLFIHWGIYSELEKGEWVMEKANAGSTSKDPDYHNKPEGKISREEYEPLASRFNPEKFDPAALVAMAKDAGMKYITITSKHHDGFAMWGTKQNGWNIVDATPYKKDVLKMLADECQAQGMKLFFYHSHLDWHDDNYYPRGRTGKFAGRPEEGDFNQYLDFMDAQLTELLTGYGPVAGIWFDGQWDKKDADWRLEKTYNLIHSLQPAALVSNNHHLEPIEGEDFQAFELDLPGQNTAGFNQTTIGALPLECCQTINKSWGYNSKDTAFKSSKELIQFLVKSAGSNANLLLNIGPKADGTIQEEFVERLHEMGQWMKKNGDSIYGTRGGPIAPQVWGVTTQKEGRVFIHVLDWNDAAFPLPIEAKHAYLFPQGTELPIVEGTIQLPHLNPIDTIVELIGFIK